MHLLIFGLCISSSWGNGHATLWRGLLNALVRRGHTVSFYEKDVPYYASTRDGWKPISGARVSLYRDFCEVRGEAERELKHTDVAFCTSYCADGVAAARMLLESNAGIKVFYDLDTPVTLSKLRSGAEVAYLPEEGLSAFDVVLSYTGGRALQELSTRLGARVVAPLYGWVDAETHFPTIAMKEFRSALSYLGTFAEDRQRALHELFVNTASERPGERFTIGGVQYPENFPWKENIYYVRHLPPELHRAFFCSSRATLNVTRQVMAQYGFCPSGRLFEAAACGTPIFSDRWEGLDTFFRLGTEILPVSDTTEVLAALSLTDAELKRISAAANARTLECHTATRRVVELETICDQVRGNALHC